MHTTVYYCNTDLEELCSQADESEKAQLKEKIELAIADIDVPRSPMSF